MRNSHSSRLGRAVVAGALAGVLGLGVSLAPAFGDDLDDRKDKVDQQVQDTQEDLESIGAQLNKAESRLKDYRSQLPGAQQALDTANSNVASAQSEVAALQARLRSAQANRAKLDRQVDEQEEQAKKDQRAVGQLAAQAYRRGGVSSDFALFLDSGQGQDMAASMAMASRAMSSQNQALADLRAKTAADRNSAARLQAVQDEITGLKAEADAALARQQQARAEAQSAKDKLDKLTADTESAQKDLNNQRATAKDRLKKQKDEQSELADQIKKRQERLKREAEERARKAAERAKKLAAEARAAERKRAANAAKLRRQAQAAQSKASSERSNATPSGNVSKSSWGLIIPATGGHITSTFGWRPTPAGTINYGGGSGYVHAGIDWGFGGQCGAPIKAAADGTVQWAGWKGTHGQIVSIDHNIVKGHALTTNYNHMSKVAAHVGEHVKQGQIIGYVGTTGNSTGCHLHFETVVDGSLRDPAKLLW